MTAQRRVSRLKHKANGQGLGILLKVLLPVAVLIIGFLVLKLNTVYWNGSDKVAFVSRRSSGDVAVTVLDPALSEETTLVIPAETQVDVAMGYGTLRIKNVWQLGLNEKLGGGLLAETVTESFLFPTTLWTEVGLDNVSRFVFDPKTTNIPFGDRIAMAFFALRVKSIDKTEIDLGKNQFLKKQTLTDGMPGYVMSGPVSGRLTVYFSDNNFADKNLKFALVDATGHPGVADGVGRVLEILGGKIVSLDKRVVDGSLDCQVLGQNSDAVKKIARLFSCSLGSGKTEMDLEMRLGGKFAKRY